MVTEPFSAASTCNQVDKGRHALLVEVRTEASGASQAGETVQRTPDGFGQGFGVTASCQWLDSCGVTFKDGAGAGC